MLLRHLRLGQGKGKNNYHTSSSLTRALQVILFEKIKENDSLFNYKKY